MEMSRVLRLPGNMHICRSSSNVPQCPTAAIVFEPASPFAQEVVNLCQEISSLAGPSLHEAFGCLWPATKSSIEEDHLKRILPAYLHHPAIHDLKWSAFPTPPSYFPKKTAGPSGFNAAIQHGKPENCQIQRCLMAYYGVFSTENLNFQGVFWL